MKIIITNHARERLKERKKTRKEYLINKQVQDALQNGKEAKGKIKKLIELKMKSHTDSIYKIYHEYIWIFKKERENYILITLYHLPGRFSKYANISHHKQSKKELEMASIFSLPSLKFLKTILRVFKKK